MKESGKFTIGQGNFEVTDEYFTCTNGAKPIDDHRIFINLLRVPIFGLLYEFHIYLVFIHLFL